MTLVSGARSAGQRERCGQRNCKTPALSVVAHVCRYVDVLYTHTCAVTECSFVCTFGSSYRVPQTNGVHPFTSSLFSQHGSGAEEEILGTLNTEDVDIMDVNEMQKLLKKITLNMRSAEEPAVQVR